jgi:hypothetical protein
VKRRRDLANNDRNFGGVVFRNALSRAPHSKAHTLPVNGVRFSGPADLRRSRAGSVHFGQAAISAEVILLVASAQQDGGLVTGAAQGGDGGEGG